MTLTADRVIEDILEREGGYVDHPADRGGPTNWGITQATLADWRAQPVTAADVQALTRDEAKRIYWHRYVTGPGYLDAIDDEKLLAFVVDYAVHSGPGRATKALQRALDVTDDGVIGRETKRVLAASWGSPSVFRALMADRLQHLARIALNDRSQLVFLNGWINRVVSFV